MNAGQLAELIAAGFWAVLVCAAVYVLVRLSRLISAGTRMVTEYHERTDLLIARAQAAVDRTNEQLARTDAITASMRQVTTDMAELSGQVTALAGLARSISAGFGTPLLRFAAAAYGVRRAVALRRSPGHGGAAEMTRAASDGPGAAALPGRRGADGTRPALPRQRTRTRTRTRTIAGSGRGGGGRQNGPGGVPAWRRAGAAAPPAPGAHPGVCRSGRVRPAAGRGPQRL